MTDAETILKMIEAVDPADRHSLNEIDAMIWFYLNQDNNLAAVYNGDTDKALQHAISFGNAPLYTRSRDALKAIRPKGWYGYSMIHYGALTEFRFWKCEIAKTEKTIASTGLPTEELAELHAIIQAIEYERTTPDMGDKT